MTEQKSNHGGKREGAGRKPKVKGQTLHVGFKCSQDVWDILQMQPNKTKYIEDAIREKHKRDPYY